MRRFVPIASFVVAALFVFPSPAQADSWDVDSAHSAAQFAVRHMMVSTVRGQLGKVSGTVSYDAKAPEKSTVDVTIDVGGINTRDEKRDGHLKSPDFFDVAKFPSVTFKSKKVSGAKGKLKMVGDLTMHGVTKEVALDVEITSEIKDPWGNVRVGASATGKLNRKEFGVVWNKVIDGGGTVLSDDVQLQIDVELQKKK